MSANNDSMTGDRVRSFARPSFIIIATLLVAVVMFVWAVPARSQTIPTISITSVEVGSSVTIQTHDFPPNQTFTVTMGPFGTQGINGTVVGTLNSGAGGSLSATYTIPPELQSAYQVAIRAQTAHAAPFYAYNWFYNTTGGTGGQPTPPPQPIPPTTVAPTFTICSVVQNDSVTIKTKDFPPNQSFQMTMGPFGTQGINGYQVGTLNSGVGGELTATFHIPPELIGAGRIAIRAQTAGANPFFAYNWFYNNTATVC